jgi:dihydrofolate reductase
MPKLAAFNNVTLDGYFTGPKGAMSWAQNDDPEWNEFVIQNAMPEGVLLFGRVTYQLMTMYWPTPQAAKNNPILAERMNSLSKIVFSRTLDKATWSNTRLVTGDMETEVRKLKAGPGKDMAILGSGSIIAQLTQAGLVDSYQVVVHPVILGAGRTMFEGVTKPVPLKRTGARSFQNGNMLLTYDTTT